MPVVRAEVGPALPALGAQTRAVVGAERGQRQVEHDGVAHGLLEVDVIVAPGGTARTSRPMRWSSPGAGTSRWNARITPARLPSSRVLKTQGLARSGCVLTLPG